MGVACTAETGTMELAETLAQRVVGLMKELQIKSLRESGFLLEDCLASAEQFAHDGAFGNAPRRAQYGGDQGIHLLYLCGVLMGKRRAAGAEGAAALRP